MEEDFIGKVFPQKCGDSLKVLEKIIKQSSQGWNETFYRCIFINHPLEVLKRKSEILKGNIPNPQIEEDAFIGHIFLQNCGDSLLILEKTNETDNHKHPLYKAQFQKYSFLVKRTKSDIKKGEVLNPQIEQIEFLDKLHIQNCGDSLKILRKTNKKSINGKYLYEIEFQKYPYILLAQKTDILNGNVDNPNLPWKSKEKLLYFIRENFKKEKPSLKELSQKLNLSYSFVCHIILLFEMKEEINYYKNKAESEILELIKIFDENVEQSKWIKGAKEYKEIDIFSPKFNLGIEYNGAYWHSEEYRHSKYHQEKSLLAKEQGINLIHIFDFEWNNPYKKMILESLLKSKMGIFDEKIGASKCKVKEITKEIYNNFCNNNHLQGTCYAKICLGLFYKEELIQIMSFDIPRFTTEEKFEWELIRECSKQGYCIIGGKEKLFKYFIKNYNPTSIISYCDFSKFNGKSYLNLGFKFVKLNRPGFWWYDKNKKEAYWRNPFKHKEMKEKYSKVYDCGQLVFVWNKI